MIKTIVLSVILVGAIFLGASCKALDVETGGEEIAETEQALLLGSCSVTRHCTSGAPAFVTCSSAPGNCVLGADYVSCDGITHSCESPPPPPPPPAACTVSCSQDSECDAYCAPSQGEGLCANFGCSPKPYIKYCGCLY